MRMRRFLLLAAIVAMLSSATYAQHAFEVASVKENPDVSTTSGGMRFLPDGIRVEHLSARFLVTIAYQLQPFQVDGLPAWASETFYDINAKASGTAVREEKLEMMQAMLVDRFRLAFHREPRELDGFALVSTGKAGPNLRESALDCEKTPAEPACRQGGITVSSVTGHGAHIWTLVQVVVGAVSAPVIDDTHLTGTYDIDLHWTNDLTTASDEPSIYTALQDQLGLKLERRKVPVDMFIVDHIERPSAD